ncbi:MAG TPA: PadR family transcriptional regulator [Acidimicrobiia bacterium]|nr:PadR family transcriptional regulator [Acidimicrobiia bacterium]
MLALSILGLLMGDPLHGYEIRKQLGELLGISGVISYGSLYPTLAKLHRQGLIDTQLGDLPPRTTSPSPARTNVFSTGSLSGDIAYGTRLPFARSAALLSSHKKKKVYTITEKGMQAFKEKLLSSYVDHADDDRAFVAHLAFLHFVTDDETAIFLSNRTSALNDRLSHIPASDHHALKLWHEVEREYIEKQIAFLHAMEQDISPTPLTP